MIPFFIFFILHVFSVNNRSVPCPSHLPFRAFDKSCTGYQEVCQTKSSYCDDATEICRQCPPSNVPHSTLMDLLNNSTSKVMNEFLNLKEKLKELFNNNGKINWFSDIAYWFSESIVFIAAFLYLNNEFKIYEKLKELFNNNRIIYQRLPNNSCQCQVLLLPTTKDDLKKIFNSNQKSINMNHSVNDAIARKSQKRDGLIYFQSIPAGYSIFILNYLNNDLISTIRQNCAEHLNCSVNDIFLSHKNLCLEDIKCIKEYKIKNECVISYCQIKECDTTIDEPTTRRYERKLCSSVINNLITFKLIKQNPRFLQLKGVYKDDTYLYIAVDEMTAKSLTDYISHNKDFASKKEKWSKQILEAQKYLNDHKIRHQNLKPSNVFVNNGDIKIFCDLVSPSWSLDEILSEMNKGNNSGKPESAIQQFTNVQLNQSEEVNKNVESESNENK